jgi:cystathionine beta-synthase
VWAARELAKREGPGKRIVTILPDSVRNYMTKFMDDQWMRENGFAERRWESQTVGDLVRALPDRELVTVQSSDTLSNAVMAMKEHGFSQLPVVDGGRLVGMVTESDLLSKLVENRATLASSVAEVMFRRVVTVRASDEAGKLRHLFAEGLVGVVVDEQQNVLAVLTKMDLVDALTNRIDESIETRGSRRGAESAATRR